MTVENVLVDRDRYEAMVTRIEQLEAVHGQYPELLVPFKVLTPEERIKVLEHALALRDATILSKAGRINTLESHLAEVGRREDAVEAREEALESKRSET